MLSAEASGRPKAKGTPAIFFLAGFPDDHGTWQEIAPRFASTHSVVTLCMPDYDSTSLGSYWGYSFDTIVSMLERTLEAHSPESHGLRAAYDRSLDIIDIDLRLLCSLGRFAGHRRRLAV